jgi:hypothetical protein
LGPRIECLERVSNFGGGRVRDLQKVRKNGRDPLVEQYLSEKCKIVCEMPPEDQGRLIVWFLSSATNDKIRYIQSIF